MKRLVRNSIYKYGNQWFWSLKEGTHRWDYHTDRNGDGIWQTVMTGRIVHVDGRVPIAIAEEQMVPDTDDFTLNMISLDQAKRRIKQQMC